MTMNEKLIVIAGMSRGGTNLLWNIVQSHPLVIDTYYELNEILGNTTRIGLAEKISVEIEALGRFPITGSSKIIRRRIDKFSLHSFQNDRFNREKFPGVTYSPQDYSSLTPCTKLVSSWETNRMRMFLRRNDALKYIPILTRTYKDSRIIYLIRNGLAVAEGWMRRGADIKTAALWYGRYVRQYEEYVNYNPERSMIIRFEDLLSDPFGISERIFQFLELENIYLDQLRIAIKPTVTSNQGLENNTQKSKKWITRKDWGNYLDVSINESQISRMSRDNQKRFIDMNLNLMQRFGYCGVS